MKKLLITALFLTGCLEKTTQTPTASQTAAASEATYTASETAKIISTTYAWGNGHSEWDLILVDAIKKANLKQDIKTPCKKLSVNECAAQLLSIMAKYESSFNPKETYTESFADSSGKKVVSRGLLQISIESANGYDCKIKKAEELHDVKTNLECGVKIISRWAERDGTLMGEPKNGCARYWSVCRSSSKSNAKILVYLKDM